VSTEEFFMYLTIALIVVIPVSVRVYRYLTRERTAKMLREQLQPPSSERQPDDIS
jgi:hypothetical protein